MDLVNLKTYIIDTEINNGIINTFYKAYNWNMWRTSSKFDLGWIIEFVFILHLLYKKQNQK
jgi:hypothetical protein